MEEYFNCRRGLIKVMELKGKGKGSPYNRPLRPRGGVEVQLYPFMTWPTRWGGWSAPRPGHFNPEKDPVPIVQEAGWAAGPIWTGAENIAPTGFRSPDRSASSESLYRLSYPGSRWICNCLLKRVMEES